MSATVAPAGRCSERMLPEISSPEKFSTVSWSVSSASRWTITSSERCETSGMSTWTAVAIPHALRTSMIRRRREANESGSASWSGSVP